MPRLNLLHTAHKKQVISIPTLSLFQFSMQFFLPDVKSKGHQEPQKPEGVRGLFFGERMVRVLYNQHTLRIPQLLRTRARDALWCFKLQELMKSYSNKNISPLDTGIHDGKHVAKISLGQSTSECYNGCHQVVASALIFLLPLHKAYKARPCDNSHLSTLSFGPQQQRASCRKEDRASLLSCKCHDFTLFHFY